MPCNTISTQRLSVGLSAALPDVLRAALESLGYRVELSADKLSLTATGRGRVTWKAGTGLELETYRGSDQAGEIKRAYSKSAVTWAASKAGWKVGPWNGNQTVIQKG